MTRPVLRAARLVLAALAVAGLVALTAAPPLQAQAAPTAADLPVLTKPVNDFANVIDPANAAELDRICRALLAATTDKNGTGDTVIIVTTPTFAPFADVREYAVKLFENHGRGIGDKAKDNGLLVVVAVNDRQQWTEVGYGLEGAITDGFAGETSRQYMAPFFKEGRYGDGLKAGVTRFVARIAKERNVSLENVRAPEPRRPRERRISSNIGLYIFIAFVLFSLFSGSGGGSNMRRRRGPGGWSNWSGGVGPFGGGWGGGFGGGGGGFGGGGGGGGFGGFGGGSSGGGGGGSSW